MPRNYLWDLLEFTRALYLLTWQEYRLPTGAVKFKYTFELRLHQLYLKNIILHLHSLLYLQEGNNVKIY